MRLLRDLFVMHRLKTVQATLAGKDYSGKHSDCLLNSVMEVAHLTGKNRVLRGGSWNNNGKWLRSANRNNNQPDNRNNNTGFRLAVARRGQVHGDQRGILSLLFLQQGETRRAGT